MTEMDEHTRERYELSVWIGGLEVRSSLNAIKQVRHWVFVAWLMASNNLVDACTLLAFEASPLQDCG